MSPKKKTRLSTAKKKSPKARSAKAPKAKPARARLRKATKATKVKAKPKAVLAPKKQSAKPKVKKAVTAKAPRRDGSGHMDPKYAAKLRELSVSQKDTSNDRAFFQSPRSSDDLAEELGEEAVEEMTSGEDQGGDGLNRIAPEENGGPFVETSGKTEFARGTDLSNPRSAKREPFPTT